MALWLPECTYCPWRRTRVLSPEPTSCESVTHALAVCVCVLLEHLHLCTQALRTHKENIFRRKDPEECGQLGESKREPLTELIVVPFIVTNAQSSREKNQRLSGASDSLAVRNRKGPLLSPLLLLFSPGPQPGR